MLYYVVLYYINLSINPGSRSICICSKESVVVTIARAICDMSCYIAVHTRPFEHYTVVSSLPRLAVGVSSLLSLNGII